MEEFDDVLEWRRGGEDSGHAELGERLMEQQGTCGLDFEGGPGNCGMVVPESEADTEGFMLTEQPTELDIIQMLGEQRGTDEAAG